MQGVERTGESLQNTRGDDCKVTFQQKTGAHDAM
jgi:hypothetical protein